MRFKWALVYCVAVKKLDTTRLQQGFWQSNESFKSLSHPPIQRILDFHKNFKHLQSTMDKIKENEKLTL